MIQNIETFVKHKIKWFWDGDPYDVNQWIDDIQALKGRAEDDLAEGEITESEYDEICQYCDDTIESDEVQYALEKLDEYQKWDDYNNCRGTNFEY